MPGTPHRVALLGHRGARGLAPENTLAGFAAGLAAGVDGFELDLALTADGVLVVHHDPRINPALARGTDGRWIAAPGPRIRDLTFAELGAYDVGRLNPDHGYARRYPEQMPADGQRIPSLGEVVALLRAAGAPDKELVLEVKVSPVAPAETASVADFAAAVAAAVTSLGLLRQAVVTSFDWRLPRQLQRIAPAIGVGFLTQASQPFDTLSGSAAGASPWTDGLDLRLVGGSVPRQVRAAGGRLWHAFHLDLTADAITEAHGLGIAVVAWTVNEAAEALRLIDAGIDGLISDRPDRLRHALRVRGLPLPDPCPTTCAGGRP